MEAEIVNMCGNLMKSPNQVQVVLRVGEPKVFYGLRCYKKIAQQKGKKGEIVLAKECTRCLLESS